MGLGKEKGTKDGWAMYFKGSLNMEYASIVN